MQVIAGSWGVGKSEVLMAIREFMELNGWGHALLVMSHTGAAASRVGGVTIDSILSANSSFKVLIIDGKPRRKVTFHDGPSLSTIGHVALILVDEVRYTDGQTRKNTPGHCNAWVAKQPYLIAPITNP